MRRTDQGERRYGYGIGEWYGRSFVGLSPDERRSYARLQSVAKRQRASQPCLPRRTPETEVECTKEGGVCSLRLYELNGQTGEVTVAPGEAGGLITTCPYRFYEGDQVFRWIAQDILGHAEPLIVREVGFLERPSAPGLQGRDDAGSEDVGRIDHVLVHPDTALLSWCALEMQAVYFSGDSMRNEFRMLLEGGGDRLPFPAGRRRPDYRSSGPKRLMPQLQVKVPTLRRWGKKMCVLVDRAFFSALAPMESVDDVSNCDICWFVVRYDEGGGEARLTPGFVHLTTLERAVEGLTAGRPVTLQTFEGRIRAKLRLPSAG